MNISNELNFSDVYRGVNYIGSLAKLKNFFAIDPMQFTLDKAQKMIVIP